MKKIVISKKTLDELASEAGVLNKELDPSDISVDPIDKLDNNDKVIKFNYNKITWITEDRTSFNCLFLNEDEAVYNDEIKDSIEDLRSL